MLLLFSFKNKTVRANLLMDLYPAVVAILNLRAYSLLSFAKRQLFPDPQILVSTSWALHIRVHSIFVPQFTGSKISKTFATDQNLAKLQSKQKKTFITI